MHNTMKQLQNVMTLIVAIVMISIPATACSNGEAEITPAQSQQPDEPNQTQQPDEPNQSQQPEEPGASDGEEEQPTTDPFTYVAINDDFAIRCANSDEATAINSMIPALEEYMSTLKKHLPAEAYDKITPDTLTYSAETKGLTYIPDEKTIFIGNTLKPFSDSLAKNNQPTLILNLFARQYFHEYLSDDERISIADQYNAIKNKYSKVYYINRRNRLVQNVKSDATTDAESYFAEITEAYLGTNNFYPFDIEELKRHDQEGFNLLEKIWGEVEIPVNEYGITMPPETLTQWLQYKESPLDPFYRKYIDANGMPIVASRFVSDSALVQAKEIVIAMLVKCPEAQEHMLKAHFRIGIIGYRENVTDMPECRIMPQIWPGTDWDARGRGYGATEYIPLMSCGEENIVKIPNYNERYPTESIMVHEFAHNVEFGLRKYHTEFCNALDAAFKNAEETNLWVDASGNKTYSRDNVSEYFAEGVQAWFNTCRMVVAINGKNTKLKYREQLKEYDPMLYDAISMVMPEYYLTGYHFDYE